MLFEFTTALPPRPGGDRLALVVPYGESPRSRAGGRDSRHGIPGARRESPLTLEVVA
jgi:hypothetical protein